MNITQLALVCLMAQASAQTCLAGTVEQFGTTQIYGMVDSEGIPMFTDIPPVGDAQPSAPDVPARPGKQRPGSTSANDTARHTADAHFGERQANHLADATPPQMRDGGLPPDDH